MAIKRYVAKFDTTITNAYGSNLITRGTGSNMGASDALEVFSIYGQAASSSIEKTRALLKFDTDVISADRTAGNIPASGSVDFYLRLYNAEHPFTLPRGAKLIVGPVSRAWTEGSGLDMEEYSDGGHANWAAASSASSGEVAWTTAGGDFVTGGYVAGSTLPTMNYSASFPDGNEDINIKVTALVEEWMNFHELLAPNLANHGVGIFLTSSQEDGSEKRSYYTKKFFSRTSEFFFKRPVIEARWDSSKKDNAGNFYKSSSLATADDNLNTVFLYNYVRGQLTNIPTIGEHFLVSVYGTLGGSKISLPVGSGVKSDNDLNVTGGLFGSGSSGIYTASFAYTGSSTTIYPVWHSGSTEYHTGSGVIVKTLTSQGYNPNSSYATKITNLKSVYSRDEVARFRLYVRQKDWAPTIYTKANSVIETEIIDNAYFKIIRPADDLEVISYGTGSTKYSRTSHDVSGNYFDLDMELLEPGYAYEVNLAYNINGAYHEQPEKFKFRVE